MLGRTISTDSPCVVIITRPIRAVRVGAGGRGAGVEGVTGGVVVELLRLVLLVVLVLVLLVLRGGVHEHDTDVVGDALLGDEGALDAEFVLVAVRVVNGGGDDLFDVERGRQTSRCTGGPGVSCTSTRRRRRAGSPTPRKV